MADKVYTPEVISNNPLPETSEPQVNSSGSTTASSYSPKTELDVAFPQRVVAEDVNNSSFDTKTRKIKGQYTFGDLGSILLGGVLIDGANNRIVVNDGTNDRIVIGNV